MVGRHVIMIKAIEDSAGVAGDPLFRVGDIVHHRRYDYRGVIVANDPECRADQAWYQSNLTQPRRDQPWYHVLVDEATHVTYVAQENLELDRQGGPVRHPLVDQFFSAFGNGRHVRNDTPWIA